MRAEVERTAGADDDSWGQPDVEWSALATVPCRAYVQTSRGATDNLKVAAVEDLRVLVPSETDVTVHDRIARITDRLGRALWLGPRSIETVSRRSDHLELLLKADD